MQYAWKCKLYCQFFKLWFLCSSEEGERWGIHLWSKDLHQINFEYFWDNDGPFFWGHSHSIRKSQKQNKNCRLWCWGVHNITSSKNTISIKGFQTEKETKIDQKYGFLDVRISSLRVYRCQSLWVSIIKIFDTLFYNCIFWYIYECIFSLKCIKRCFAIKYVFISLKNINLLFLRKDCFIYHDWYFFSAWHKLFVTEGIGHWSSSRGNQLFPVFFQTSKKYA